MFLGQGSKPHHICDLHHSCGNAGSLTFCTTWELLIFKFHSVFLSFFFLLLLGLHLQHMEVPRLGLQLELQLPAFATATATENLSGCLNLHHSSQQCWRILNPLSEARDGTCNLMVTSQICFCCAIMGTPKFLY